MHNYFVRYVTLGDDNYLKVFPNWWKLLLWFIRESRDCQIVHIWIQEDA